MRTEQRLLLITLVVLAGCYLRLSDREVHSLRFDEACTVQLALADDVYAALELDRQPPLTTLLFRYWIRWMGQEDATLRLLPALAACLSLVLFAFLARLWAPDHVLSAVAVFAVAPFQVWYGQELRAYSFLILGAVLALLGLALVLRRGSLAVVSALLLCLGCATALGAHYFGGYLLATLGAIVVGARWSGKITWKTGGLVLLVLVGGCAVWIPSYAMLLPAQLGNEWGYTTATGLRDLAELPIRQVLTRLSVVAGPGMALVYACGIGVLATVVAFTLRTLGKKSGEHELFVLATLAVPYVAGLLIALLVSPAFLPKYLAVASPGVALAIPLGTVWIPWRMARAALLAVILGGCVFVTFAHRAENHRENYRAACAELCERWQPGDLVFSVTGTYDWHARAPVQHYLRDRPDILATLVDTKQTLAGSHAHPEARRIHVIRRRSTYTGADMDAIKSRAELLFEGPELERIQYLLFRPRTGG